MEKSGELLHLIGCLHEAIECYTQQLKIQPNYNILIQRAIAYTSQQNFQLALKDLQEAIILDPSRYEAFLRLGNFLIQGICELQECKLFDAKRRLEKAMQIAPEYAHQVIQIWRNKCDAEIGLQKPNPEVQGNRVTYSWYQTDKLIKIQFPQVVQSKEDINCKFQEKIVDFSFKSDTGALIEYSFELYDEIDPQNSKVELNLQKIELQLAKKVQSKNWPKLNAIDIYEEVPIMAPTSAKVKRDWSKIDKDIEKELSKEKEGDPMNDLFKQIYSNADENTRKAMIKSFQTSGGTVLSTNWDEVKQKDYENKDRPSAPDGQVWNKW